MGVALDQGGGEEAIKEEGESPPVARENLIATAIKFLENSKIRSTSTELKTTFLKKKGLTDEEIASAFKEVRTLEETHTQTVSGETGLPGLPPPNYMASLLPTAIPKEYPISKKVRDVLNVILLIGGFGFGINYLWKKYLRPWWYGIQKQSSDQILLQTSQTLLTTVLTLKEGMDQLQASLDKMSGHETRSENEVTDLKKEVMSLKGLLLSRRLRSRQSHSSSSFIPRASFAQSEPSTPYLAGLISPGSQLAGAISPAGSQAGEPLMSPELEFYGNKSLDKSINLIDDIDD